MIETPPLLRDFNCTPAERTKAAASEEIARLKAARQAERPTAPLSKPVQSVSAMLGVSRQTLLLLVIGIVAVVIIKA